MNIINKYCGRPLWFTAILLTAFVTGCSSNNDTSTTDTTTDPAALTVTLTNPANAATAVATNQKITATFSESMNEATLDSASFTVIGASGPAIDGTVSLDAASNTAIFAPVSDLTANTVYTATITTAAASTTGKTMASNHVWSFTSNTDPDSVVPEVSSTNPANATADFYLNRNITASFSESIDPSTVNITSFTLAGNTVGDVTGDVSYNDNVQVATFNPDANLASSETYTATLTTDVQDLASNALAAKVEWTFTTGTTVVQSRPAVNLDTAGDFAILAKTAITKTGTAGTMITGHIGVSPAALSDIAGFSVTRVGTYATSDYVNGHIYAADLDSPTPSNMTTSISNMETAYTDAAGRSDPDFTELGAGNITGMTLEPGLYKWGTNVLINNAGVTISGSVDDVWIFQIAGDLIVDNAAKVTLADGALPENIFWQVEGGTGVAIGTTAEFKGVVLAQKAITVNTGATVNGRLLAQSAVTLDGNVVTQP
ncbi:MAG: ice-binding family protein [Gammaproteobacteria bacterium]|jgi:hypothetical protein|nr:ice-binding family protein [Gammaproteobacteria bacterium]